VPRALWTGSLSFGLINVPVQLRTAVRDLDLHFRQIHEKDKAPIEMQRWCSQERREVPYEEITHSYELESGKAIVITDEELEAVEPRKTRTIDIEQFVSLSQVDPIYFDHPYFLVPAGESEGTMRAYLLLVEVMRSTDRAALGRFVMRAKEYLALIRVRDGALSLTTMLFADEIRPRKDVADGRGAKTRRKELEQAVALIESLAAPWRPQEYEDRYRARLEDVVARKRRGQTVKAPKEAGQPAAAPDLMAALERSLARARGADNGSSATGDDGSSMDLDELDRGELYERAKRAGVPGRSKMSKEELAEALSRG
jgi:DNA end-binding protein Ku